MGKASVFRLVCAGIMLLPATTGALLPESTYARRQFLEYMTAPFHRFQEPLREYLIAPGEDDVLVRTYEQAGARYYVFLHPQRDVFDVDAPGTWIIRRRLDNGDIDQIKIFLQPHEGSFLRLTPAGRTTRMEVSLAGAVVYRNVPVPISMQRALVASFEMIRRATAGIVDWGLLLVDADHPGYATVAEMVSSVRPLLPGLPDAEDGAMDSEGNLVFIETLEAMGVDRGFNCSGFAKWIVDGIYGPRTGRYLAVEPLKRKHLNHRGTPWSEPLEDSRDPWFGLDWTRNLAGAVAALDHDGVATVIEPTARDVRDVPFTPYIPNVGYAISDLQAVLYWLALREPGTIYLGSVSRSFGSAPVLRQHSHVVVFFPWFDSRGQFQLSVMERNVETGLVSLNRRYPGDFVHLVRVTPGEMFQPPPIPSSDH